MNPSLWFFFSPNTNIWSWSWGRWSIRGPARQGACLGGRCAPTLVDRVWAPWRGFFFQYFLYIPKIISVDFQVIPRTFISAKNNTMAILLKTTSVWVSSIQIMQIRVQNKGKGVWKSRYDGDVSTPPKLNPLLVLKQFSWQTESDKEKAFTNFVCSCCCKYVKPAFKFSAKIMN